LLSQRYPPVQPFSYLPVFPGETREKKSKLNELLKSDQVKALNLSISRAEC